MLHGVESFDKAALKPTETQEKIVLPDPEGNFGRTIFLKKFKRELNRGVMLSNVLRFAVIAQEKGQQQLRQGIESFDTAKLKHAETQEKHPLPTQEGTAPLNS